MKTYQLYLESGNVAAGTFEQDYFGEFRTSSRNVLIRTMLLASSGAIAIESGHERMVAHWKNRMVEGVGVRDRSDNPLIQKVFAAAQADA